MAHPALIPAVGAVVIGTIGYMLWGGGKKTTAAAALGAKTAGATASSDFKKLVESKGLPLPPTKQTIATGPSGPSASATFTYNPSTDQVSSTASYPMGKVVTQTDPLNLRSGPGTTYDVIGSIPKGAMLEIIKDLGGAWLNVRYSGQVGFAAKQYVAKV
jgi:uncharacterized protein YgiM (DUF1202 family)